MFARVWGITYEGGLKSSYADYDAMVKFDQMWFVFLYSLPCGPHTSSIGVAVLGFLWYRNSHPDGQINKVLNCRYDLMHLESDSASQPSVFFMLGKLARWCQIRRVWRVTNQFQATVTRSSHCNHRLACRNTVPVKQDSLHQCFRPECFFSYGKVNGKILPTRVVGFYRSFFSGKSFMQ